MSELLTRLVAMRSELVDTMAAGLEADPPAWSEWLPLLSQIEVAIRATRIVEADRDAQS